MVDKTLGREASQEPLHNPLFEVQVDDLVVQRAWIFKDDRT
jgi:hypothetical protein